MKKKTLLTFFTSACLYAMLFSFTACMPANPDTSPSDSQRNRATPLPDMPQEDLPIPAPRHDIQPMPGIMPGSPNARDREEQSDGSDGNSDSVTVPHHRRHRRRRPVLPPREPEISDRSDKQ